MDFDEGDLRREADVLGASDNALEFVKSKLRDKRRSDNRSLKVLRKFDGDELDTTWELHHRICQMIALGMKNVDVARHLGCDKQTVSNVRNSELGMVKIQELRTDGDQNVREIYEEIREYLPTCLETVKEVMEADETNARDKANVAFKLMEIGGVAPEKKVHIVKEVGVKRETLEQLSQNALKAAEACGIVVDAEFEEVKQIAS